MRIVSFNVNSIRAREHQLALLCERYDPDIIGLQETKVQDSEFPCAMVEKLGYQSIFYGQKSHYGVAILSKQPACAVEFGLPGDAVDAQRRLIRAEYCAPQGQVVTIVNGYFPQGEHSEHAVKFRHKREFYAELYQLLCNQYRPEDRVLVLGDMNVAPAEKDVGIGSANVKRWLREGKCSFLPEEREWLQCLFHWGLHDTFRTAHSQVNDRFSWFDYRSKGFAREPKRGLRIDLILATASLNGWVTDAGIAYDIRAMDKPSDHAPVWVDIEIS
jgi:exodeoxyribonuclease-3